jgi:hypothetical protein
MILTNKIYKEINGCGGLHVGMRYLARRYARWLTSGCCVHWYPDKTHKCELMSQPTEAEKYSYLKLKELNNGNEFWHWDTPIPWRTWGDLGGTIFYSVG